MQCYQEYSSRWAQVQLPLSPLPGLLSMSVVRGHTTSSQAAQTNSLTQQSDPEIMKREHIIKLISPIV